MTDMTLEQVYLQAQSLSHRINQINEACATAASIAAQDLIASRDELWKEIDRRKWASQPAQPTQP